MISFAAFALWTSQYLAVPQTDNTTTESWIQVTASASRDVAHAVVTLNDGSVIGAGAFSTHLRAEHPDHRLFNQGDYDIYIERHDRHGQLQWRRAIGGPGLSMISDIAHHPSGRVCVAGRFTDRIGGVRDHMPELQAHGASDAFLACLDAESGDVIWARRLGGKQADLFTSIAISNTGEIWVGGGFTGTVPVQKHDQGAFEVLQSNGEQAAWLLKIDDSGAILASHIYRSSEGMIVKDIALAPDDAPVLLMRFAGKPDNLAVTHNSEQGASDLLVLRQDKFAKPAWLQQIYGPGAEDGAAIAINESGDIGIVGAFVGEIFHDGQKLKSHGSSDVFVWLANSDGDVKAFRRFGKDQADVAYAIAADRQDWLIATSFIDHTQYGAQQFSHTATSALLLKIDATASPVHSWLLGGTGLEQITAINPMGCGKVAIVGQFNGDLEFNPHDAPIIPAGKLDAYTAVVTFETPATTDAHSCDCLQLENTMQPEARDAGNLSGRRKAIRALDRAF